MTTPTATPTCPTCGSKQREIGYNKAAISQGITDKILPACPDKFHDAASETPLLPCPFCGDRHPFSGHDARRTLGGYVKCDVCERNGHQVVKRELTEAAAIAAWNRRAAPSMSETPRQQQQSASDDAQRLELPHDTDLRLITAYGDANTAFKANPKDETAFLACMRATGDLLRHLAQLRRADQPDAQQPAEPDADRLARVRGLLIRHRVLSAAQGAHEVVLSEVADVENQIEALCSRARPAGAVTNADVQDAMNLWDMGKGIAVNLRNILEDFVASRRSAPRPAGLTNDAELREAVTALQSWIDETDWDGASPDDGERANATQLVLDALAGGRLAEGPLNG